jgi:hypothetical protein
VGNFSLNFKENIFRIYLKKSVPLFDFPFSFPQLFNKTSFTYDENFGMTVLVKTPYGTKRFLIDTGCTVSCLKPFEGLHPSTIQLSTDELPFVSLETFIMGQKNYGPFIVNIADELNLEHFDGILGMDFFHNKVLYFDMTDHFFCIQD